MHPSVHEEDAMASPHEVHVTLGDRHAIAEDADATLGKALERVLEAQQDLVVRRASLLIEELIAKASDFASRWLLAVVGSLVAIAGWFISMVGVIDALDDYFARFAVELALGAIHVAAGIAMIFVRRTSARAST
jgi:hypothetical protein